MQNKRRGCGRACRNWIEFEEETLVEVIDERKEEKRKKGIRRYIRTTSVKKTKVEVRVYHKDKE